MANISEINIFIGTVCYREFFLGTSRLNYITTNLYFGQTVGQK